MATIIWCDRVKHIVSMGRSEVADLIDKVQEDMHDSSPSVSVRGGAMHPRGYGYFDIEEVDGVGGGQRALNVRLISSFEAAPGDPI